MTRTKRFNFYNQRYFSLLILLISVLCLIPLIFLLVPYAYYQVFDVILPKVRVGDVDVGGLQINAAKVKIDRYFNYGRMLLATDGIHEQYLIPQELGLNVDAEQSAQQALNYGHGPNFIQNWQAFVESLSRVQTILPVVIVDNQTALGKLQKLNEIFRQPPTAPQIIYENGSWVVAPGGLGSEINLEESLHKLAIDAQTIISTAKYTINLKPVPPPEVDLTQAASRAEEMIRKAQQLKVYDAITNEWLELGVTNEMAAGWLKFEVNGDPIKLSSDPDRINRDLMDLGNKLGGTRYLDPEKISRLIVQGLEQGQTPFLLVNHHPTTYTVQKGDTLLKISWRAGFPMWKILEANPGLDSDHLYDGQVINIPSKDDLLPLDIIPNKRIVISLSKQRLMVYENNQQIKKFVISTGVDRSPTQPGVFQVQTHKVNAYASVWDLYMPNFLGIYEAWPGFMNGIHGLPMLSNGTRLWANVLGKPASYGCIILDLSDSKYLYQWADNGVVVEIIP